LHVLRGGSWTSGGNYCRVTYRNSINPDFRVNNFGFRCARDVDKLTNKAIELKQNNEKTFSCGTQISYAGKTYNTVQIGLQCWLKENLDVGTMIRVNKEQTNNNIIEKYCYDDNINNCNKYGGLYQWNEAMQYVTKGGVQGICPIGWHIPTKTEFETLEINVNKDGNALKEIGQGTGKAAGTNSSGFSALLAGSPSPTGSFFNLGTDTNF